MNDQIVLWSSEHISGFPVYSYSKHLCELLGRWLSADVYQQAPNVVKQSHLLIPILVIYDRWVNTVPQPSWAWQITCLVSQVWLRLCILPRPLVQPSHFALRMRTLSYTSKLVNGCLLTSGTARSMCWHGIFSRISSIALTLVHSAAENFFTDIHTNPALDVCNSAGPSCSECSEPWSITQCWLVVLGHGIGSQSRSYSTASQADWSYSQREESCQNNSHMDIRLSESFTYV